MGILRVVLRFVRNSFTLICLKEGFPEPFADSQFCRGCSQLLES
jgi:hypothetical protein